jgi:hypothetical protein
MRVLALQAALVRDRTRGDTPPATNFKRSNVLYRLNSHLDRDKDMVALVASLFAALASTSSPEVVVDAHNEGEPA